MQTNLRPYRAVFFDLDGTLLPMDLDDFLKAYFKALVSFVSAQGLDGAAFNKALMAGVGAMTSHDDGTLNAEAFWGTFFGLIDGKAADWGALLDEFYESEFGKIGADVVPDKAMVRAVATLKQKGYPLVLATMPLFPPRAVRWRLAWAGLDADDFARVTHYENSASVKPKLAYYAENLAACGLPGEDVLMVGNNTVEDVAACELGADVYLVTDNLLDPVGFDLSAVKHSSTEGFAAWVETLPACESPASNIDSRPVENARVQEALRENMREGALLREREARAASDEFNGRAMGAGAPGRAQAASQAGAPGQAQADSLGKEGE